MERSLIAHLRRSLPGHPALQLGIGDDAALLDFAGADQCVISVDVLTDQVDFLVEEADPRRIGRKALAVNLSDLAAMAAEPVACVVGVVLPRQGGHELALGIAEGMAQLAREFNIAIAGGDTNSWDGRLVISVTVIGRTTPHGALQRSGAKPGDRLLVTGRLGGSILGHHFDFTPRVREALHLNAHFDLHAGMDISDGLLLDLSRLCEESGVGARIDLAEVPVSPEAERLARRPDDTRTALEHALADGEDFELLLAVSPEEAKKVLADPGIELTITDIGCITDQPGLQAKDAEGRVRAIEPDGFRHDFD